MTHRAVENVVCVLGYIGILAGLVISATWSAVLGFGLMGGTLLVALLVQDWNINREL